MKLNITTNRELSHTVQLNSEEIVDLVVQEVYTQLGYSLDTKAEVTVLVKPVSIAKGKKNSTHFSTELPSILVTISNPELPQVSLKNEDKLEMYKNLEEKHG